MFFAIVERAQVGEFLGSRRLDRVRFSESAPIDDLRRLGSHSCALFWSIDPAGRRLMPDALVTEDGQEREWLAWLTSFAQVYRPFTAYCRILGARGFIRRMEGQRRRPDLEALEGAFVGLVLGEVLASDDAGARLREPLPASACFSMLGFAAAREKAIYGESFMRSDLTDRWEIVRKVTRQRDRPLPARHVQLVVDVLDLQQQVGLPAGVYELRRTVEEMLSTGGTLRSARMPLLGEALTEEGGTREARVARLELAVRRAIADRVVDADFALGYLASRVNPGTLVHAPLLVPALERYPAAMLWYGVCAGISDPNAILAAFGGLGRRVLRELYAPHELLSRTRCDLAWDELDMFLRERPHDPPEFTTASANQLSIELDPGIWTTVGWSRAKARRTDDRTTDDRAAAERAAAERAWLTEELGASLHRLAGVYNHLRHGSERERAEREREHAERNRRAAHDSGTGEDPQQPALPLGAPGSKPGRNKKRR
jgi:hypothetical protein